MKVKYDHKIYTIEEASGETIRIKNKDSEFCILKDEVTPYDKEAKEIWQVGTTANTK